MATLPTVPSFVTGETPSIVKLNQLAGAAAFITTLPAWCQLSGSGQNLTTGTVTALTWTETDDRDNGHSNSTNPARYTAQTPGYYDLAADVRFAASGAGDRLAFFQVTTGANNPGGAGLITAFGALKTTADNTGTTNLAISMASPYLYLLDYVEVYAQQTSGGTLATDTCFFSIALAGLGP